MYIIGNRVLASKNKLLAYKSTGIEIGTEHDLLYTFYDAEGNRLNTPQKETLEYFVEKLDKEAKIRELKEKLSETDYKCLKFADGSLTEEEYAPIREERKLIRQQINNLESQ